MTTGTNLNPIQLIFAVGRVAMATQLIYTHTHTERIGNPIHVNPLSLSFETLSSGEPSFISFR